MVIAIPESTISPAQKYAGDESSQERSFLSSTEQPSRDQGFYPQALQDRPERSDTI